MALFENGTGAIAFLLPDLGGGGAERVSITLAASLSEMGHSVEFVLLQRAGALLDAVPSNARIVTLSVDKYRNAVQPIMRYLKAARPRALISSMWPLTSVAALAHKLSGSKAELIVWEHCTLSSQYSGRGPVHRLALSTSIGWTFPLARERIAVSGGVADDLARLSGLPRDTISVVYNPIPKPPEISDAERARADQLWPGPKGSRIISVGQMKAQKNQALLLRSFARLLQTRDCSLIILGEGALRDDLRALATSLRIADRVSFPGFAINTAPYYATADMFVLSSDYEGFGNVVVEAMHHGLRIVSTDCPAGPAEILANGQFGLLTPVGDEEALAKAMLQSLEGPHDPQLVMQRAADFAPETIAKQFLGLMRMS